MSSGVAIARPTILPSWRRWRPVTDGPRRSAANPCQTRASGSRTVLHLPLAKHCPAPAPVTIGGESALLIQPIAMRHVANRDHLMTFPGRRILSEEPSTEAAVLGSPDSGNPAVVDIAGLINTRPLSSFQKGIMVL